MEDRDDASAELDRVDARLDSLEDLLHKSIAITRDTNARIAALDSSLERLHRVARQLIALQEDVVSPMYRSDILGRS